MPRRLDNYIVRCMEKSAVKQASETDLRPEMEVRDPDLVYKKRTMKLSCATKL